MATIKSWSYSSLKLFEKCPAAYWYSKVEKLPRKSSPAAERGIAIHAKAEQFLLGKIQGIPPELRSFKSEMLGLKRNRAAAEKKYCLTASWTKTGWVAKDSWLRLVIDAELPLNDTETLVVDFKTGRVYESHQEQAELYATALLQLNPGLEAIHGEFWYLDKDLVQTWTFKRGVADELRAYWEQRAGKLFAEEEFLPTPSKETCKWCDFKEHCDEAVS